MDVRLKYTDYSGWVGRVATQRDVHYDYFINMLGLQKLEAYGLLHSVILEEENRVQYIKTEGTYVCYALIKKYNPSGMEELLGHFIFDARTNVIMSEPMYANYVLVNNLRLLG